MFENVKKVASKLMYAVPVVVFLGFVCYITAMTYTGTVQKTVEDTECSFDSFVSLSNKFEKTLQEGIYKKYGFINLDGLIAKILGFNSLNQRQKLANGYLAYIVNRGATNVSTSARSVIKLNNFLHERGINFLYVLAPSKESIYDAKFAPGYENDSWKNITNVIKLLSSSGVETLDMNSWFKGHSWRMEDVFFKTDHHWRPQAGLAAAQRTMEILQQQGIAEYDKAKLQEKNYRIKILKDWFLGADGKRTGKYYAGVDNISVYRPKFATNYVFSGLMMNSENWKYSKSMLRDDVVKHRDYFKTNPYAMYMHGDFSMQFASNTKAINTKRLLIIGNSFANVYHYFLTTQFQQIYRLDLRYYKDGSLAEYIEEIKPDVVLMCTNASRISEKELYEFGIDEYNKALEKSSKDNHEISVGNIEAKAIGSFTTVISNLKAGQTYTLTIDRAAILGLENEDTGIYVQMVLQDLSTNKPVKSHYFEANKTETQKWIFKTPSKKNTYAIYLYAGAKGKTVSADVQVTNAVLKEGVEESYTGS